MKKFIVFTLIAFLSYLSPLRAEEWKGVAISGGGYFTGMNFAPDVPGLQLLRSDVSGPWIRTSPTAPWSPTRWAAGSIIPNPQNDGASGLAVEQGTKGQVIYGEYGNGYVDMGLYKSLDGGKTWNQISKKWVASSAKGKFAQPVVIDPNNPAVVYWGTQREGVWRSLDSGATWEQVSSILEPLEPKTGKPTGSRSVVIDPSEQVNGRSKVVYISVHGLGVYRSTSGGDKDSFVPVPGQIEGFVKPNNMALDGSGALYASYPNGVAKFESEKWQNITPPGFFPGGFFATIAVDKVFENKKRVVVHAQTSANALSHALWRSLDGGISWQGPFASNRAAVTVGKGAVREVGDTPGWIYKARWAGAGYSVVVFDPFEAGSLYLLDAYQTWKSTNIWQADEPTPEKPLEFRSDTKGADNLIVFALHAPRMGDALLFTGSSDVRGFRHTDLNTPPADMINLQTTKENWMYSYCTSFDSCDSDPQHVWVVTHIATDKGGWGQCRVYRSTDNGATFTGAWEPGTYPHGTGRIAVSATDPNNAVLLPGSAPSRYTLDGGETWQTSKDAAGVEFTKGFIPAVNAYDFDMSIAADKVNGNYFYAFNAHDDTHPKGAYWSSDRGATWNHSPTEIKGGRGGANTYTAPVNVKTVPGREGEVWLSLNGSGIWRSTDHGKTYTVLPDFKLYGATTNIAFGKPAPGAPDSNPIVYAYGTLVSTKERGYFYSTDYFDKPEAATWTRITGFDDATRYPLYLEADRRVTGRIYVGSSWGVATCVVDAFAEK